MRSAVRAVFKMKTIFGIDYRPKYESDERHNLPRLLPDTHLPKTRGSSSDYNSIALSTQLHFLTELVARMCILVLPSINFTFRISLAGGAIELLLDESLSQ